MKCNYFKLFLKKFVEISFFFSFLYCIIMHANNYTKINSKFTVVFYINFIVKLHFFINTMNSKQISKHYKIREYAYTREIHNSDVYVFV